MNHMFSVDIQCGLLVDQEWYQQACLWFTIIFISFFNCWRIFNCWFPSHYSTFIMHTMYSTVFSILADLIMSKNSGPNSKMIKCLSWSLPCLHVIVLFHYFGAYMSDSDCSINIIDFQNVKNYLYIHIVVFKLALSLASSIVGCTVLVT